MPRCCPRGALWCVVELQAGPTLSARIQSCRLSATRIPSGRYQMRPQYTRFCPDQHGASRFAEVDIGLSVGLAVPPANLLCFAQFLTPVSSFRIGARPTVGVASAAYK